MSRMVKLMSSAGACALLFAAPAMAQDAEATRVDEILVTAQKRSQRLIDVPSSIAAVSEETIRELSLQQLSEIANHVPNLAIDASSSLNSAVYIRGVGANSRNIGFDTRVGVYLDGVYLGQSPALNQELFDLERVEVLRGPQGALFGKNTVAGAINLISRQPDFTPETWLSARAGSYGDRQASARVNLPLSDTLAVKLSVNRAERDGFTDNIFDGSTTGSRDVLSWRAQARWDVSDRFSVLASVDSLRTRETAEYGNAITNTFGTALAPEYARPRTVNLNTPTVDERDVLGTSVEAAYEFDSGVTLKSITSWRGTEFFSTTDVDYSALDILSLDWADQYDQYTQEFQVISPAGGRIEYVAGLYLYQQDSDADRRARVGSLGPALGAAPGAMLPTIGSVRTRNVALYGNLDYELTERLTLGVGLRASWEEKEVAYTIDSRAVPAFGLGTGAFADSRTDRDVSPTVTLSYAFAPRLTGFARYARGYKSGGYNLDFVSQNVLQNGLEFDKEVATSYEAGIKGDLLDRTLTFSATAFQTEFDDFQVDQFQAMGNTVAIVIGNASKVRSRGIELEGAWQATDRLSFNLGLGVQEAIFTSFPGGGAQGSDASGRQIPGASKLQGNLGVTYVQPVSASFELALHADYTHRGAYYSDIDNARSIVIGGVTVPFDRIEASDLVNARIALRQVTQGWEAALWSRNLFDEDHVFIYGGDFFGTRTRRYAPPRTWGIEVSARF
jgi:iron complex outermembrane receptor protein